MEIYVGASLDRPPGPKYTAALSFAELRFPSSRPKPKTLARWRESVGADFAATLLIPRACTEGPSGPFKLDDTLERELTWLAEAARAVEARVLVLPTHRAISTGQRDRDRLARYLDAVRARAGEISIAWLPGGLWDLELSIPEAAKRGLAVAVDPLDAEEIPAGPLAYLRLVAVGARSRISPGMSLEVVERLAEHEAKEAYVVIESERSVREAEALATLLVEPE